jgi:uncharacterized protein with HEPN domain
MLDTARKVCGKSGGLTRERFDADEDLRLALLHLVQVIGEAARRVSAETQAAHPEIPWREITGMRHKIVHDYMDISEGVLWEVVTKDLPRLLPDLEEIAT